MSKAVIVAFARTPFTPAAKGSQAKTRAEDMAAAAIRGVVEKSQVNKKDIESVIMGCAFPEAEQGFNVARIAALHAGLDKATDAATVNRFCGSSMEAIHIAAGKIAAGMGDVFVCAGVESMSHVPMTGFNPMPHPEIMDKMPGLYMSMGVTAENVAKKFGITRQEQDEFASLSHKKAAEARIKGLFKEEIVNITGQPSTSEDECVRPGTTAEKLAGLKAIFDANGSVTAGTSSPLTDGAVAVLVVSEEYAKKHNLPILAEIVSFASTGCEPEIMGMGPVEATRKALAKAGLTIDDIDVAELNEAFASQAIACIRELGIDPAKVNLDGGALALGHPLGATGARITAKAAQLLSREGGTYALSTQCIGGGQGIATILKRPGTPEKKQPKKCCDARAKKAATSGKALKAKCC